MGLDMYLTRKIFVWSDKRDQLKIVGAPVHINENKVKVIEEEAGYWRKANAIHKWFVDNVQDGNDDCHEYYVSTEQMEALLDLVKKVLEKHDTAPILLPCEEGFFFGGQDYDQYYFEDLEATKKILETAIKDNDADYYYQSSW